MSLVGCCDDLVVFELSELARSYVGDHFLGRTLGVLQSPFRFVSTKRNAKSPHKKRSHSSRGGGSLLSSALSISLHQLISGKYRNICQLQQSPLILPWTTTHAHVPPSFCVLMLTRGRQTPTVHIPQVHSPRASDSFTLSLQLSRRTHRSKTQAHSCS